MNYLDRGFDFGLLAVFAVIFYLLISPFIGFNSVFQLRPVHLKVVYYSTAGLCFSFLFVFGLIAYLALLDGKRKYMAVLVALAEAEYFFASLVLLLGLLRWFVPPVGVVAREPIWLSFLLLWTLFGCWFWLLKRVKKIRLKLVCTAVYGIIIVFHFPLALSAFCYFLPGKISFVPGIYSLEAQLITFGLLALVYARFFLYFHRRACEKLPADLEEKKV